MRICFSLLLAALLTGGTSNAQEDESLDLVATPSTIESSLNRGVELFLFDNIAGALPFFQQAIVDEPRNPDAYVWLAETLRRTGDLDEAEMMARLALALR